MYTGYFTGYERTSTSEITCSHAPANAKDRDRKGNGFRFIIVGSLSLEVGRPFLSSFAGATN